VEPFIVLVGLGSGRGGRLALNSDAGTFSLEIEGGRRTVETLAPAELDPH
jgi:hypothetical protein